MGFWENENGIGSYAEIVNEARFRVRTAGQASSGTRRREFTLDRNSVPPEYV